MSKSTDFWDPRNPIQKADRLRFYQRKRLVGGLCLDSDLTRIHGCLLQGQGAGKALRVVPLKTASVDIPFSIRQLLLQAIAPDQESIRLPIVCRCDLHTLHTIQYDLTLLAEGLIDQLKAAAGQASDQILAICLADPSLILQTEEQTRFISLLDAERIAFRTSLNVIDQLATKDLLSGGQGWPLTALGLWMIWADRTHPAANQSRLILECDDVFMATFLPPSDGLDAEYPDVQQVWLPGLGTLLSQSSLKQFADQETEYVQNDELLRKWKPSEITTIRMNEDRVETLRRLEEKLSANLKTYHKDREIAGSLLTYWMNEIQPLVARGLEESESFRIVIVDRQRTAAKFLTHILKQRLPQALVSTAEEFQCESETHSALQAATMAFLHIDQMPANLPWITGADHPRILGRLTPGSPSRYRNLLVEMADYRPPVMKLRDAV